jgi:hypothetical protein
MPSPSLKYLPLCLLLWLGCKPNSLSTRDADFELGVDRGVISDPALDEASGLVASQRQSGLLWAHNDTGDENRLFLLNDQAQVRAQVYLEGCTNRDWEDIAATVIDGKPYLYVGDIGDNIEQFPTKTIYRLPEPDPGLTGTVTVRDGIERITFRYPDGQWNSEAMFIDHATKDIYLVTKREATAKLFRLPAPQSTTALITAEFVMDLVNTNITAADTSPDNAELLLKNYDQVLYWRRRGSESYAEALARPAKTQLYFPEPQGEAIAFTTDRSGYFTLSEERNGIRARLLFYRRK